MLGLSMTATAVGWALVDGADDGAVLAGDEFRVSYAGAAAAAVQVAARVAATVQQVAAGAAEQGRTLSGIALAFSPAGSAGAALTLEALAAAGIDAVTQVRFGDAAAALADGAGVTAAVERTAVCVLEPAEGTLVGGRGAAGPTDVAPVGGGADVIDWLTEAFDDDATRPDALVLAGTGAGLDKLGRRLEQLLDLPVFVHSGARLGLARGAALALRPAVGLIDEPAVAPSAPAAPAEQAGPLTPAYAGAMAMLVGGAVTFVASLSAALSLQLGPGRATEEPVTNASASTVDPQPAPAAPAPAPEPAAGTAPAPDESAPGEPAPAAEPEPAPAPEPVAPAAQEVPAAFATKQDALPLPPPPMAPPPSNPSLRDRIKQHLPHLPGH